MRRFDKITIVGVGLIGGSIGLAIKNKKLAHQVVGVGHRQNSINRAIKLKTIDRGTLNLREGVKDADIVILATPVLTIPKLAKKIKNFLKTGCVVTDVGSVKSYVVKELGKVLPRGVHFVGGHPMAGSEKRGVEKARNDLFKDSICILTKTEKTNVKSLKIIKALWLALGAKVVILPPGLHDRIVSEISHLPHMVAFSILNSIDKRSLAFASSGFYDATRIASSDTRIWKDIAISNKAEIAKSISKFKESISLLEKAVRKQDSKKLLRIFRDAKKKREMLLL